MTTETKDSGGGWSTALVLVLVAVLLAGALFGYDQGVISGALTGVQRTFKLSSLLVEVVTSWVTLGALAGSLPGGGLRAQPGRADALHAATPPCSAGAIGPRRAGRAADHLG